MQPPGDRQVRAGRAFRDLHLAPGIFVMPNAWNAGGAMLLESAGFAAIGTTSAGIAYSLGLPDYADAPSRDAALEETRRIADAVAVPVSADAENGYGDDPRSVADTICMVAETGAVGASIEDHAGDAGLYELDHAVERIAAARAAADALGFAFTLTARAECFLVDHPDPFAESVRRVNAYREAGADCLFVPGLPDTVSIAALVREAGGPVSVVMGLAGNPLSMHQLEDLGVKRVSIGGSLARACFGLIRRAADELRQEGTFGFAHGQIADAELCAYFSHRRAGRDGVVE